MGEYIIGRSVPMTRQEAVKITRITFYNGNAAVQSVAFSNAGLTTLMPIVTVFAPPLTMVQFDYDGLVFRDGFTATPSHIDITDIVIEYEDLET